MTVQKNIAVLIPCLNEETTIIPVIQDFQSYFPESIIYVFDNLSTDKTAAYAKEAGAEVILSPNRGKGNVLKHMLETIDAKIYILVDGDFTYRAKDASRLIETLISTNADMVSGNRFNASGIHSLSFFRKFGNFLITKTISLLYKNQLRDILTGLRVFTPRFKEIIKLRKSGFEVETEITLEAISKNLKILEVDISYFERPEGSFSKLNAFQDGLKIFRLIFSNFSSR